MSVTVYFQIERRVAFVIQRESPQSNNWIKDCDKDVDDDNNNNDDDDDVDDDNNNNNDDDNNGQ